MSQELLNSIIAKVAVHLPLMAKGIVENSLEKIGVIPSRVTPRELKKALDEYIIPTLRKTSGTSQSLNLLGGGFIYTDNNNHVKYFSKGVYQYVTKKLPIDHEDFFNHLHELGLVKKIEEFDQITTRHIFERICISRPQKSILEVIFILLVDESNEVTGTISTIRDITLSEYLIDEVSLLYEKLRQSYDELKEKALLEEQLRHSQKMEAIGQLVAGIAHDFNNMILVVSGFADLILSKFAADNSTLENYAQIIKNRTMRAAALTANLLAFSRKGKHQKVILDVHAIIQDVLQMLEHTMDRRIKIIMHLNAKLSTVNADYSQLQNAFLNMALNAKDAIPNGGELIFTTEDVMLDGRYIKSHKYVFSPGAYIMISITDTGVGMTEEMKAKIFEPFYTTKEVGRGTGLGLSSVYGTVRNHGGTVEVYSELGKGTTFKVYLPVAETFQYDENKKIDETIKGSGKILFIDDDEATRFMTSEIIKELGYSVHDCKDGLEGIDYYRNNKSEITLIILDLAMPEISGYDCFQELRKINNEAKVIISSGYSMNGEVRKILDKGAVGFIQKPFDIVRLSNLLKSIYANET
jgi:signal transduction histidine kinase/ActR/RegA family two-component response regulator